MMNYIEYKEGKVYNPSHLRPFDLELAKQGHPLAWHNGNEVSHIFFNGIMDSDVLTSVGVGVRVWNKDEKLWHTPRELDCLDYLRLAPLNVKDGKPLHVGDVIEALVFDCYVMEDRYYKWETMTVKSSAFMEELEITDWRWPAEVKA